MYHIICTIMHIKINAEANSDPETIRRSSTTPWEKSTSVKILYQIGKTTQRKPYDVTAQRKVFTVAYSVHGIWSWDLMAQEVFVTSRVDIHDESSCWGPMGQKKSQLVLSWTCEQERAAPLGCLITSMLLSHSCGEVSTALRYYPYEIELIES